MPRPIDRIVYQPSLLPQLVFYGNVLPANGTIILMEHLDFGETDLPRDKRAISQWIVYATFLHM